MSGQPFDPDAVIDAMAPFLGLDIQAEHRAGVAANLRLVQRMAAVVLDGSLGDHAEPAALFVPAGPASGDTGR